jgi:NAD(P)-dependent dehydrogenase (short-subunit alcohol dehydrogenase family)
MASDLTDKVIIITGASSGIGAATALACAKAGMDVVISARRGDRLKDLEQRVASLGRRAESVAGDVIEPGISARMIDAAMNRFGRFDAVFANAGYGFHLPMIQTDEKMLRDIFEVNFFAGVDLLQKSAAKLIELKQPGHLLMCSSCIGKFTMPHHGSYCATKAAQNHICRAMNIELRSHDIHVSSVHPIGTLTEFFETSAARTGGRGSSKAMKATAPRFFMQPAERVANAVVKCLRNPRPEVWTSFTVRFAAALLTLSPRLGDMVMREVDRRARKQIERAG